LGAIILSEMRPIAIGVQRTDDQRNHGRSISSGSLKTLDELLDLPDLDVLLGLVCRWVGHDEYRGPSTAGTGRARNRNYARHNLYVFAIVVSRISELFWSWIVASSAARFKLCGTDPSERESWLKLQKRASISRAIN
jgi:hypothetical protein